MKPFATQSSVRPRSLLATGDRRLTTPLRRFRPPLPVKVEVREKRPVRMAIAGSWLSVAGKGMSTTGDWRLATDDCLLWAAGPWHESGEWWTGQSWSRETWDVALKNDGAVGVYRIFRDVLRDEWFMEAMYD